MESNSEDYVRNVVKSAYSPARPPAELKKEFLKRLEFEASSTKMGISRPLWEKPRVLVPVLVAIISALIGYGAWLSLNVVPALLP